MPRKALVFCTVLMVLLQIAAALPAHAQARYPVSPTAPSYAQPGEVTVAMRPVLLNGRTYAPYFFTTGAVRDVEGGIFYDHMGRTWARDGVKGFLVLDGSRAVTDETVLRRVFQTALSGYMAYTLPDIPGSLNIDQSFINELDKLTTNPVYFAAFLTQQAKSIWASEEDQYMAALQGMLAAPSEADALIHDFTEDVKNAFRQADDAETAITATAKAAKYSNSKETRAFAASLSKQFRNWENERGTGRIKIDGIEVEFVNGLEIFGLAVQLMHVTDLSLERAEMLERLVQAADRGEVQLPATLRSAMSRVIAEARSTFRQRVDIILSFVRDKGISLINQIAKEELLRAWAHWAWDKFGTKTIGHLVAGVWARLLFVYSAGSLLYGMDAIFEHTVTAQKAVGLSQMFASLGRQVRGVRPGFGSPYDAQLLELYRSCAIFRNLADAQAYHSYADRVASSRLIVAVADLLSGKQWSDAIDGFHKYGKQAATVIDELIGHPKPVDDAIALIRTQPVQGRPESKPQDLTSTATLFVLDVSGSMSAFWQGGVKLDSAKNAALDVVNMIEQESELGETRHQVGLVTFSEVGELVSPLTADYRAVADGIGRLYPLNNTNLGDGLAYALSALNGVPPQTKRIIILLSDGMVNAGLSPADILAGPVQEAAKTGTCIYTVGFGNAGELDEELLRQIAQQSGCGEYFYASAGAELDRIYIALRHQSTGAVLAEFTGQIAQGERLTVGEMDVPAGQGQLNVSLQWPGSRLELAVKDPQGRSVTPGTPGVSLMEYARLVYLIVENPAAGKWLLEATGVDVPEGQLTYNAIASVRPKAAASTDAWAWVLVALLGIVMVGAPMAIVAGRSRSSYRNGTPLAHLVGGGRQLPIRSGMTVGRGPGCSQRVRDETVSRLHVRFDYANGEWYVQDLKSLNGTHVNGKRVSRAPIRSGDRIRLGRTELEFRTISPEAHRPLSI